MKKNILILLLSIISIIQANAQADCSFDYCYVGSISTNTKITKNNKIIFLVPSPEFMLNILGKERGFGKMEIDNLSKYEYTSVAFGSPIFCKTLDEIIEEILKGNQKFYTIYITKNGKKYEKKINIKKIKFSHKDGIIYIKLPPIKI